jgi:uncharacterized protein YndB with AHSA1/START domain
MTSTQIGKLAVRRSIEIEAAPERVWQEFESQERLQLWYSTKGGAVMPCYSLTYEPRVGGEFSTRVHHGDNEIQFTGKVVAFDPPRELTVEMGPIPAVGGHTEVTLISFLLHALEAGRTKMEIVHHGFEAFGDEAERVYRMFEGGWNMAVPTALKNLVETGNATGA